MGCKGAGIWSLVLAFPCGSGVLQCPSTFRAPGESPAVGQGWGGAVLGWWSSVRVVPDLGQVPLSLPQGAQCQCQQAGALQRPPGLGGTLEGSSWGCCSGSWGRDVGGGHVFWP